MRLPTHKTEAAKSKAQKQEIRKYKSKICPFSFNSVFRKPLVTYPYAAFSYFWNSCSPFELPIYIQVFIFLDLPSGFSASMLLQPRISTTFPHFSTSPFFWHRHFSKDPRAMAGACLALTEHLQNQGFSRILSWKTFLFWELFSLSKKRHAWKILLCPSVWIHRHFLMK